MARKRGERGDELWRYGECSLDLDPVLVRGEVRYPVPTHPGEGWGHVLLKVSVATHLLEWGYSWKHVHWEDSPCPVAEFRPDIFAERQGGLPAFWFECGGTEDEKLRTIRSVLPEVRVVNVIEFDGFPRWWNRGNSKEEILAHRQQSALHGVEYWALREGSSTARFSHAVRRDADGCFTYMDTGEAWTLSGLRYVSKRRDRFGSLIPGFVGIDQWKGENSELLVLKHFRALERSMRD
jgi:hypothetical protein